MLSRLPAFLIGIARALKKLADTIHRVGLIANTAKPATHEALHKAARLIAASGRTVLTEAGTAELARLRCEMCPDASALARASDLLLVFGGDGTMLRAAREVAGSLTPILGVKFGGLGFLTAVSYPQLAEALRQVWAGSFALESRPLIKVSGEARGRTIGGQALNDFVISRGSGSRMIELEVSVNGELLTHYFCDGFIISSPTGSTAYSLAAGGAIVSPEAEVFTLTPICPHTLSNRSVIVSLSATLQVRAHSQRPDTILSADGELLGELHAGESVTIRRSRRTVRLVRLQGSTFFETLRQKLNWSGTSV